MKTRFLAIVLGFICSIGHSQITELFYNGQKLFNTNNFTEFGGTLYFSAEFGSPRQTAIFSIDSTGVVTNENTFTIIDSSSNPFSALDIAQIIVYNDELFISFLESVSPLRQLYRFDTDTKQLTFFLNISSEIVRFDTQFGSRLYFSYPVNGFGELHYVDVPNNILTPVAVPGADEDLTIATFPREFITFNGRIYYTGTIGNVGGAYALYSISPNGGDLRTEFTVTNSVIEKTVFDNKIFFIDIANNRLYSFSDVFALGFITSVDGQVEFGFGEFNGNLVFAVSNATTGNNELAFLNTNNVVTRIPCTTGNAFGDAYPLNLPGKEFNNQYFFAGASDNFGRELFTYANDNSEAIMFQDFVAGNGSSFVGGNSIEEFANRIYLGGFDGLHTIITCVETVDIEDAAFEEYIENELNAGDGILGNKKVCKEKIQTITELRLTEGGQFNGQGFGIEDLSGIEHFEALELLWVQNNDLTSLDLRQNTELQALGAFRNNIASLNLEGLTQLTVIGLSINAITQADFSSNTAVEVLDIENNNLESITLGDNINFVQFRVTDNPNLQSLDISGIDSNLTTFSATGLSSLSCIQVSSEQNANAQAGWSKDTTTEYSTNCNNQPFTVTTSLGGEVVDTDPAACCTAYEIVEGQLLEIYFESDATATDGEDYVVQLSLAGSEAESADISNRENSPNLQYTYTVKAANPDNTMQIDIVDDGILEAAGENLRLTFTPVGSNFTFSGTTVYNIKINDKPSTPFEVNASVSGNVTGTEPNYTVEEGQPFNLNFDANASASNGTVYNPVIAITQNGSDATAAFTIDDLDKSFTVSGADPDGRIQFVANDDGNDTGDEVYTISITSENSGEYTIAQPTSFTITVTDRPNNAPILLQTTVVGATPDGADYRITEGQTLGIQIEALNGTNGESFTIPLDLSNTTAQAADYSGPETSFQVTIDNTQDPDGVLSYAITANDGDESDEILDIILDQPVGYQWQSVGGDGFLRLKITIEDEDTGTNANVVAVLTNTGGMESESAGAEQRFDEITLQLFDEDGNVFTSTETITFEVNFNTEGIADEEKAEAGDFVPEKQTFTIPAGSSSDTIQVIYPREDPDDLVHDFYNVDIVSVNASFPIGLPSRLTAKILDISAPFTVEVRFRGIADLDDSGGPECCIYRRVEENSIIRFDFFAEKGVPTAMNYRVQIVTNNEPEDADEGATPATFRVDFTPSSFNEGTEGVFPYNGFPDERDGTWNVRIEDDNIPDELESFRIDFEDVSANLENSTQDYSFEIAAHKFDFTIIEAIPANIELVNNDDTLNEEEPGDFLQLRVYLETPSNDDVTVSFEIDGDENDNDFTISSQNPLSYDETTNSGNITLFSGNGVQEAFITVTSINEPEGQEVNEGAEEFIFSLIDGFGYKLGNSIVQPVTLIDDDQADFDVVLNVPVGNETIFEDNTRPTTSFFEISFLDGMTNTSNSPLPINFEILPNANSEPQLVTDYRIYDGEPSLGREITNETMKSVTVETGASKGFIYVVVTEDDGEIEEPEAINIRLDTGVGYNLPSPNNTKTITIISKEQDTSTLNPANISATVSSATCPDVSEGEISMTNSSPFVFTVDLLSDSGQTLDTATLEDFTINPIVLFEDLAPGEYQLKLSTDTPDIFPPNFTLSVRNNLLSTQLVSSSVDKSRNEAALVVSGSSYYEVRVNDRKYEFEFESESQNTLMVPLENGTNEILVDGLAPCQGTLKSTLTLANYKVFPNPSPSKINFSGFTGETKIDCYLFDGAGRLVLSTSTVSNGLGEFELDVANLPQGTYFGRIVSLGHKVVQVKLLKN